MSKRRAYSCVALGVLVAVGGCSDNDNTTNPFLDALGGVADAGVLQDTSSGVSPDAGAVLDTASTTMGIDAAATTFTQVYTQVIAVKCSPCHTTATGIGVTMGNLDMTSQAAAFMNLVNVPAAGVGCAGMGTRVVPGMPKSSIMFLKVSLDDPTPCGAKMPFGLPALSRAETDLIQTWILGGALNN